MEKVCAAWWRDPDEGPGGAGPFSPGVVRRTRGGERATLHVEAGEHAALWHGTDLRGQLLTALASVWLDSYQDLPELPGAGAAWLVASRSAAVRRGDVLVGR